MLLQEEQEEEPELQMAPMIDIIFQLIIFFMCATSFKLVESELKTNLPTMSKQVQEQEIDNVIIQVDKQGRILVEGKEYDSAKSRDLNQLIGLLSQLKRFFEKQPVIIQADKTVDHQRIVDVLNACAAAGIDNVSFVE